MARRCRCKGSLPEFTDRCERRATTLEQLCKVCRDLDCDNVRGLRSRRRFRETAARPPVRRLMLVR